MKHWFRKSTSVLVVLAMMSETCFGQVSGLSLDIAFKSETPKLIQIDIPAELASVEEFWEAPARPNPKMILHIQNAHTNYEAQQKIRDLMTYLNKNYGFKTIFVEGASENLNPDNLKLFPDAETNKKLWDELARRGQITGADWFLLEESERALSLAAKQTGTDPNGRLIGQSLKVKGQNHSSKAFNLAKSEEPIAESEVIAARGIGIEKAELYRKNYEALKAVYSRDAETKRFLTGLDNELDKLATKILPPETRKILAEWKKFEAGHREFMPFVENLSKLAKANINLDLRSLYSQIEWPQLTRLLVLQNIENKLKQPRADSTKPIANSSKLLAMSSRLTTREAAEFERAQMLAWLKSQGLRKELIEGLEKFNEQNINMNQIRASSGKMESLPRFFIEKLIEEAGSKGLRFSDYPNFALYTGYLILKYEIEPNALFGEIKKLFEQLLKGERLEVKGQNHNLKVQNFSEQKLPVIASEAKQSASVIPAPDVARGQAPAGIQSKLIQLFKDSELMRKLLSLELSREEWQKTILRKAELEPQKLFERVRGLSLATKSTGTDPNGLLAGERVKVKRQNHNSKPSNYQKEILTAFNEALSFYDLAIRRDEVFYQKMAKELENTDRAILMSGGFHTDGLKEKFREHEISYGTLTPRLTQVEKSNLYREVMMGKSSKELFQGQRSEVKGQSHSSKPVNLDDSLEPTAESDPAGERGLSFSPGSQRGQIRPLVEAAKQTGTDTNGSGSNDNVEIVSRLISLSAQENQGANLLEVAQQLSDVINQIATLEQRQSLVTNLNDKFPGKFSANWDESGRSVQIYLHEYQKTIEAFARAESRNPSPSDGVRSFRAETRAEKDKIREKNKDKLISAMKNAQGPHWPSAYQQLLNLLDRSAEKHLVPEVTATFVAERSRIQKGWAASIVADIQAINMKDTRQAKQRLANIERNWWNHSKALGPYFSKVEDAYNRKTGRMFHFDQPLEHGGLIRPAFLKRAEMRSDEILSISKALTEDEQRWILALSLASDGDFENAVIFLSDPKALQETPLEPLDIRKYLTVSPQGKEAVISRLLPEPNIPLKYFKGKNAVSQTVESKKAEGILTRVVQSYWIQSFLRELKNPHGKNAQNELINLHQEKLLSEDAALELMLLVVPYQDARGAKADTLWKKLGAKLFKSLVKPEDQPGFFNVAKGLRSEARGKLEEVRKVGRPAKYSRNELIQDWIRIGDALPKGVARTAGNIAKYSDGKYTTQEIRDQIRGHRIVRREAQMVEGKRGRPKKILRSEARETGIAERLQNLFNILRAETTPLLIGGAAFALAAALVYFLPMITALGFVPVVAVVSTIAAASWFFGSGFMLDLFINAWEGKSIHLPAPQDETGFDLFRSEMRNGLIVSLKVALAGIFTITALAVQGQNVPTQGKQTTSARVEQGSKEIQQKQMSLAQMEQNNKEIQQALRYLGYPVTVDGLFGGQTAAAIIDFQKKKRLTIDGTVGIETKKAILEEVETKARLKAWLAKGDDKQAIINQAEAIELRTRRNIAGAPSKKILPIDKNPFETRVLNASGIVEDILNDVYGVYSAGERNLRHDVALFTLNLESGRLLQVIQKIKGGEAVLIGMGYTQNEIYTLGDAVLNYLRFVGLNENSVRGKEADLFVQLVGLKSRQDLIDLVRLVPDANAQEVGRTIATSMLNENDSRLDLLMMLIKINRAKTNFKIIPEPQAVFDFYNRKYRARPTEIFRLYESYGAVGFAFKSELLRLIMVKMVKEDEPLSQFLLRHQLRTNQVTRVDVNGIAIQGFPAKGLDAKLIKGTVVAVYGPRSEMRKISAKYEVTAVVDWMHRTENEEKGSLKKALFDGSHPFPDLSPYVIEIVTNLRERYLQSQDPVYQTAGKVFLNYIFTGYTLMLPGLLYPREDVPPIMAVLEAIGSETAELFQVHTNWQTMLNSAKAQLIDGVLFWSKAIDMLRTLSKEDRTRLKQLSSEVKYLPNVFPGLRYRIAKWAVLHDLKKQGIILPHGVTMSMPKFFLENIRKLLARSEARNHVASRLSEDEMQVRQLPAHSAQPALSPTVAELGPDTAELTGNKDLPAALTPNRRAEMRGGVFASVRDATPEESEQTLREAEEIAQLFKLHLGDVETRLLEIIRDVRRPISASAPSISLGQLSESIEKLRSIASKIQKGDSPLYRSLREGSPLDSDIIAPIHSIVFILETAGLNSSNATLAAVVKKLTESHQLVAQFERIRKVMRELDAWDAHTSFQIGKVTGKKEAEFAVIPGIHPAFTLKPEPLEPAIAAVTAIEPIAVVVEPATRPGSFNVNLDEKLIYVIDDESVIRALLRMFLEMNGYEVMEAEDGQIALDEIRRRQKVGEPLPGAFALDLNMPNLSGDKLLAKLMDLNYAPPVVLISGSGADEVEAAAAAVQKARDENGVKENIMILAKSFTPTSFMEVMQNLLLVRSELRKVSLGGEEIQTGIDFDLLKWAEARGDISPMLKAVILAGKILLFPKNALAADMRAGVILLVESASVKVQADNELLGELGLKTQINELWVDVYNQPPVELISAFVRTLQENPERFLRIAILGTMDRVAKVKFDRALSQFGKRFQIISRSGLAGVVLNSEEPVMVTVSANLFKQLPEKLKLAGAANVVYVIYDDDVLNVDEQTARVFVSGAIERTLSGPLAEQAIESETEQHGPVAVHRFSNSFLKTMAQKLAQIFATLKAVSSAA